MQLLHECTNQHALKIDSSATKRKILQQQQVSYPSSCFAIHIWSKIIYKVALESQYTYNIPTIADFQTTYTVGYSGMAITFNSEAILRLFLHTYT